MRNGGKERGGMIKKLNTEKAYVFWAPGIILGAIGKHFLPGLPYVEFASFWTIGFLGIGGKRLIQKHEKFRSGD